MPNFVSYATSTAELAMQKNRVLNHSITHLPSLFDAPGTEALALHNTATTYCSDTSNQTNFMDSESIFTMSYFYNTRFINFYFFVVMC